VKTLLVAALLLFPASALGFGIAPQIRASSEGHRLVLQAASSYCWVEKDGGGCADMGEPRGPQGTLPLRRGGYLRIDTVKPARAVYVDGRPLGHAPRSRRIWRWYPRAAECRRAHVRDIVVDFPQADLPISYGPVRFRACPGR
jgi:hypothetical protein